MCKSLPCPMLKDTGNSGVCGQVTALAHRGHAHPAMENGPVLRGAADTFGGKGQDCGLG